MNKNIKTIIGISLISLFLLIFPNVKTSQSTPSTNVKNTLSSSQLSYFARIGVGSSGDNLVKINTAANPSRTTNNLFEGDTVCIASSGGGCTSYSVTDIGNTAYFQVSTPLPAANGAIGSYIIATRSAQHVITFTPQSTVAGGKWQILIKATNKADENYKDGIPDQEGFDIGATAVGGTGPGAILRSTDVTCPWAGMTVSGIGTTVGVVAANGTTYYYHTITCALGAGVTNPIGSAATFTIGGANIANSSQLINPAPNHTASSEGVADLYNFFVRHLDSSDVVIDSDTARGQIAMVEAVRVTATVDPTISFTIDNVGVTNVGTSVCPGAPLKASAARVTATQVPFESLLLQSFNDLAQRLTCTTNAPYGYTVTVYEDMPLTMIGGSTTIPNTICNSTCTSGVGGEGSWNSYAGSVSKFGYSLNPPVSEAATTAFTTGASFNAKPFGVGSANAATIFSKASTPTGNERTYICYRTTVTNTQPAGNYENKLIYTATATF